MLTQCPNCKKAIVLSEPGIHDCPRCHARIWISKPDDENEDRVLIGPEVNRQNRKEYSEQEDTESVREMVDTEAGQWLPPWEDRRRIGFSKALITTWKSVMFLPSRFFGAMDARRETGGVLLYGWIFLTLGTICWSLYRLMLMPEMLEAGKQLAESTGQALPGEAEMAQATMMTLLGSPLISLVTILLNTALYHGILRMIGSGNAGLRGTFRVVVYGQSAMLLLAFPFIGEMLAVIWNVVLTMIGLSRVHLISHSRSLLAIFLPPIALYLILVFIMKSGFMIQG